RPRSARVRRQPARPPGPPAPDPVPAEPLRRAGGLARGSIRIDRAEEPREVAQAFGHVAICASRRGGAQLTVERAEEPAEGRASRGGIGMRYAACQCALGLASTSSPCPT